MKKITITTDFTAEVPDDTSEDQIQNISLDLDVNFVRVDNCESGPIKGAFVTGYGTTGVEAEET